MKLSPSIKHLLTLRNPLPNASPSVDTLHGVFAPTLSEAARHHAQDGWLALATSTLLSANAPAAVGHLYRYVSRRRGPGELAESPHGAAGLRAVAERTAQAALMREAALKSAIFVGVPRTIQSLEALTGALEDDVRASLRTVSLREATAENVATFQQRGQALWKDIYAPHDAKLAAKLAAYHPDFISFILQSYGGVLSPWPPSDAAHGEPGNVGRTLTSVVGVACLRAEGGVGPQLVSHVYGLLKAQGRAYAGAPASAGDAWLATDAGIEWVIRTVDAICDVVRRGEVPATQSKL